VFHINLSWEGAALPPFGSGKFASFHCKPGKVTEDALNGELHWTKNDDVANPVPPSWTAQQDPWKSLVSSCTYTFLTRLMEWSSEGYDFLTMVEMANPGVDGMAYIGRARDTLPLDIPDKQQMDPKAYKFLSTKILKGYGVFGNVLVGRNVVIQATYWKKSTYSKPTVAVGLNMMASGEGRPISALFFEGKKTLIVNVHGVHFRKTLINSPEAFGDRISQYKSADPDLDFKNGSIHAFNTKQLQKLYGRFVTDKIAEALKACTNGGFDVTTKTYCEGDVAKLTNDLSTLARQISDWNIIVAGDINDETMELSKFRIFGIEVSVPDKQRKRTCCSDRDADFKKALAGQADENDSQTGTKTHTIANLDYMVKDCGYLSGKNCQRI
jgi:hypothetical protein